MVAHGGALTIKRPFMLYLRFSCVCPEPVLAKKLLCVQSLSWQTIVLKIRKWRQS